METVIKLVECQLCGKTTHTGINDMMTGCTDENCATERFQILMTLEEIKESGARKRRDEILQRNILDVNQILRIERQIVKNREEMLARVKKENNIKKYYVWFKKSKIAPSVEIKCRVCFEKVKVPRYESKSRLCNNEACIRQNREDIHEASAIHRMKTGKLPTVRQIKKLLV